MVGKSYNDEKMKEVRKGVSRDIDRKQEPRRGSYTVDFTNGGGVVNPYPGNMTLGDRHNPRR